MAHDADFASAQQFSLQAYECYALLMADVPAQDEAGNDAGLGGQLFWAGLLDTMGRACVVAGNVAGAATLAATNDADTQRRAVRDGIVDFLVTSLDEALRILKNEVRKRATVAVCIAAPLDAIEREMRERGVQPDCCREDLLCAADAGRNGRTAEVEQIGRALVQWRVEIAPALWLPRLDEFALDCLDSEEQVARRWIRLSGRYLGRLGRAGHLAWSTRTFAARFVERVVEQVQSGALSVRGQINVTCGDTHEEHIFGPAE